MSVKVGGSVLALAVILGCAGGKTTTSGPSGVAPAAAPVTLAAVAGEYALVTVDGHALPVVQRTASGVPARSVVSGSLLLGGNGTFKFQTGYTSTSGGSSAELSGACYPEGNDVKMVWDDGGANMTLRGDTAFVKRDGAMYAYIRRR